MQVINIYNICIWVFLYVYCKHIFLLHMICTCERISSHTDHTCSSGTSLLLNTIKYYLFYLTIKWLPPLSFFFSPLSRLSQIFLSFLFFIIICVFVLIKFKYKVAFHSFFFFFYVFFLIKIFRIGVILALFLFLSSILFL